MASRDMSGNPNLKNVGQTIQWTEETLEEYKNCMESPQHFIENYVQIVHVDKGLVPFTMYPYQEKMVQTFNDERFVICKVMPDKLVRVQLLSVFYSTTFYSMRV